MPANRDENGKFVKGAVANPSGRPKKRALFAKACREMSEEILEELKELVFEGKSRDKLEAIKIILAYGFGKPSEHVEVSGNIGPPQPVININLADIPAGAITVQPAPKAINGTQKPGE